MGNALTPEYPSRNAISPWVRGAARQVLVRSLVQDLLQQALKAGVRGGEASLQRVVTANARAQGRKGGHRSVDHPAQNGRQTTLLHTFSPSPLPEPEPHTGPLPSATPPDEMAVYALVTGVNHRVAAYGYCGGSLFERRDFSMAGTLVKHPQGDLLIDTGFGRNIAEQFATMPSMFRVITFYSLWQPAVDQLGAAGYDQVRRRLVPRIS